MDEFKVVNNKPILLYGMKLEVGTCYGKKPITISLPYVDEYGINGVSTKTYHFIWYVDKFRFAQNGLVLDSIHIYHPKTRKWYTADTTNTIGISKIDRKYRLAIQNLIGFVNAYIPPFNANTMVISENDDDVVIIKKPKSNRQKKREAFTKKVREHSDIMSIAPHEKRSQFANKSMVYRGVPGYATNPNIINEGGYCGVAPAKTMPKAVVIKPDKPELPDVKLVEKTHKRAYKHNGNSMAKVFDSKGKHLITTNYNAAQKYYMEKGGEIFGLKLVEC